MPPRIDDFDPNILAQKDEEINATFVAQQLVANVNGNGGTHQTDNLVVEKKKLIHNDIDLPIVWRNVAVFALLHIGALYGVYLMFYAKWSTLIFGKSLF